ncbi:ATP-grasp domain-containing protein [Glycomyces arizonensis]|uniref:ATP-grasp domain-containing protein n=1 Tax=Glycomyces arizonensis TaxID=256035 RepID=UPI000416723F|nr:ATP-grasp domain-containing protein [Glycomyces arizonensis]
MHILLIHVKKNRLPEHVLRSLEADSLTVITEPGHLQQYGPGVDVRLVRDVQDVECLRAEALALLRQGPVDRIFMPFELGQAQAAFLRDCFGIPGIGFAEANALTNKYVMKLRLREAGLPQAAFAMAAGIDQIERAAEATGWPVIVKRAVGGGSIDVFRFDTPEEVRAFAQSPASDAFRGLTCPLVVESLVDIQTEYHCDGIVDDGEVRFAKASEYFVPVLDHGEHFGTRILPDGDETARRIRELHRRAVEATGLRSGVTHMEFFATAGGLLASEIACRPAGGGIPRALALQTGVDVWQACLDTSLGRAPAVEETPDDAPGTIAHWYLTVPAGRITAMTDEAELRRIEGVVDVAVNYKVGDAVPDRQNSASAAMLVFARADGQAEVERLTKEIYGAYRVEVGGE